MALSTMLENIFKVLGRWDSGLRVLTRINKRGELADIGTDQPSLVLQEWQESIVERIKTDA
jgi:hypothetical protein